jgi:LuxR family maltose regulon positive regulatory protein
MEKGKPALNAYLARLLGEFSDKQAAAAPQLTIDHLKKAIGEPLTDREVEVLRLLATSMTSNEIAAELYIAPSTARTHIKNIYSKLSVNRRMEAVHRAKELGVI